MKADERRVPEAGMPPELDALKQNTKAEDQKAPEVVMLPELDALHARC
jgi:hypothetical protein